MQCEKCGSDNTQRLQVAYESGTQEFNAESHTAGVGSISGALGLSGSITETKGTSQSVLAQKAAPPAKKPLGFSLVCIVIGLLCLAGSGSTLLFGLAAESLGGFLFYRAVQFNSQQWPGLYQHWQGCWVCRKCGHFYHQASME